jgi:hypothetical protein
VIEPKVGPNGEPIEEEGTAISKFKSAQDRDNAYLELEKKSRSDSQRLADLEAKLEQIASMQVEQRAPVQNEDRREFSEEYKNQDQLKAFWARFASKPEEVFKEREEQMIGRISAILDTRSAVENFKLKNPDLAKHEELMTIFVKKTPANLSPAERLNKAAPEVRKYLAEIARPGAASREDDFNAEAFVESPSGSRESSAPAASKEEPEDSLAEAIREHSRKRAAAMNPSK